MIYTAFKCTSCRKETIVLTEELEKTESAKRYITCAHCNSKQLKKEKTTDDLRECMQSRTYKRIGGAIRQVIK